MIRRSTSDLLQHQERVARILLPAPTAPQQPGSTSAGDDECKMAMRPHPFMLPCNLAAVIQCIGMRYGALLPQQHGSIGLRARGVSRLFQPKCRIKARLRRSASTLLALTSSRYLSAVFGAVEASFWKRGSFRSGSNIGSSRSSAGVRGGTLLAKGPS